MDDLDDKNITAWDTVTDYAIGGVVGVGSVLLGIRTWIAVLIAVGVFVAVNIGKSIYRGRKGTDA
jgi:hypothetical protein